MVFSCRVAPIFMLRTTIPNKVLSAFLKNENNSKNPPKQNTNPPISIPKPKNKSNSPNPPHTPKNNLQTQK